MIKKELRPLHLLLMSAILIGLAFGTFMLWMLIAWDWDPNFVVPVIAKVFLGIACVSAVSAPIVLICSLVWLVILGFKRIGRKKPVFEQGGGEVRS
jgi:hypothetical protein